ncbi:hypothetical protein Tco_0552794 [Tanacetum coccineum]
MGVTLSGSQGLSSPEQTATGPNRLASPRVNGYLVKASSNPFTFHDSPLPGVNTPWDVMRIVCNPELMDVAEVVQIPTGRYVVPTGRVIATVSIKVPTGRGLVQLVDASPQVMHVDGLEVGSIRHIQGLDTAYWGFLGVGTMLDIFQNIHILFLEYGVLSLSGYGVLSFNPMWSLVSTGTDTPYLP